MTWPVIMIIGKAKMKYMFVSGAQMGIYAQFHGLFQRTNFHICPFFTGIGLFYP